MIRANSRARRVQARFVPGGRGDEALEPRQLMAAGDFAAVGSNSPNRFVRGHPVPEVLSFDPAAFKAPAGRPLLVRVEVRADPGSTLDPGRASIDGALPRGGTNGIGHSVSLIAVRRGASGIFRVAGDGGSSGAYTAIFRLAGDLNGDFRVTREDLFAFRRRGTASNPAADLDGDGRVNARDLQLARGALGASTSLRPLGLGASLDPADDPDGDGIVASSEVNLLIRTAPNASIVLARAGGVVSYRADAEGYASYRVDLAFGEQSFLISASDEFGQRQEQLITVRRAASS